MSVILRKRKNKDGTTSLRLDIHHDGRRWAETLIQLKLVKPNSAQDREANKLNFSLAEKIAVNRAHEFEANNYNIITDASKKTSIEVWMQNYIDNYTKKDKRNMQGVLNRFSAFLKEIKKTNLTFGNITALIIEDFIDFLQEKSVGEGAKSYYARFKKMLKNAYRKKLMKENILDQVERKVKGKAKKKDTLTLIEIQKLAATPTESSEVKRAALFSCLTGLAWVDIKQLTWNKIRVESRQLELVRAKLKTENTTITIPLNTTAIKLLGKPGKATQNIFVLPTANGANKTLKAWVKRAKIEKNITCIIYGIRMERI